MELVAVPPALAALVDAQLREPLGHQQEVVLVAGAAADPGYWKPLANTRLSQTVCKPTSALWSKVFIS